MRLRNVHTGVQVVTPDDKARRLVEDGTYEALPDDQQPPPTPTAEPEKPTGQGHTSIAAALHNAVGPMWDTPTN